MEFYGGFIMNNTTDVEVASIDSDKVSKVTVSFVILLRNSENLKRHLNE